MARYKYKWIRLTPRELQKCFDFSVESAGTQQAIEFGQSTTAERKLKEIARDNLIGKMAEVAVVKMLKEDFGIDVPLDFDVYDRGKWDDNDIVINGWNIDIKSTRIGHWLLIEWNKLVFRQKKGKLPHAFFMCKTDWNMDKDLPLGTVQLVGSISLGKLKQGSPNVLTLRKGENIPQTRVRLQADNFAVEFKNLNHDWETIINYMLNNPPPNLSDYPNPYTSQTTPQHKNTKTNRPNNNLDVSKDISKVVNDVLGNKTSKSKTSIFEKLKNLFRK